MVEKNNIPKTITALLLHSLKPFILQYTIVFIAIAYLGLHISLEAYIIKIIIDKCIEGAHTLNNSGLIQSTLYIGYPLLFLIGTCFLYALSSRTINYVMLVTIPKIKKSIALMLLHYVWGHSERFFKNELSGSLANKISDVQESIKNIIDNLRRILRLFLEITLSIFMVMHVNIIFSVAIFLWSLAFIVFSKYFSKKMNALSFIYARYNNLIRKYRRLYFKQCTYKALFEYAL